MLTVSAPRAIQFQGTQSSFRPSVWVQSFAPNLTVSKMLDLVDYDGILLLGTAKNLNEIPKKKWYQTLTLADRLPLDQTTLYVARRGIGEFGTNEELDNYVSKFHGFFWRTQDGKIFYSDGIKKPSTPTEHGTYLKRAGENTISDRLPVGKSVQLSAGDTLYFARPGDPRCAIHI